MQAISNKVVLWLRELGVSSKIITDMNGNKSVYFEVHTPHYRFRDNSNVLTVNIIPFFRDAKYSLRVSIKGDRGMFLPYEKQSIQTIYNEICNTFTILTDYCYNSKYDSKFIEGCNVLFSKQIIGKLEKAIISSKEDATKFFKDEKEVLKELLAQVKEIANTDLNSDLFYQRFFPSMDKAEVDSLFKDMAASMCEKPPKKLIGFADIPKEVKEQRDTFTDLLKSRIMLLKIKEILG